ncbi:MAG: hypothetical protein RSE41_00225 [Clostridia bacterium]
MRPYDDRRDENGNDKAHYYEWGHKTYYDDNAQREQERDERRREEEEEREREREYRRYEM